MKRSQIKHLKNLRYIAETFALIPLLLLLYTIKIDMASSIMGYLFRKVGPYTKASKVAKQNINNCFPNFSDIKSNEIIYKIWENIGRTFGEITHWHRMSDQEFVRRVKIIDHSNGDFFKNQSSLILSAHYGNWEIYPQLFYRNNIKHSMVYRKANNTFVNYIIQFIRMKSGGSFIPKSISGMRDIITDIKKQHHIGMLVDQKTNTGIIVPFFNKPAYTTAAPANIALKFSCPIFMTRVIRTTGANYIIEIYPALTIKKDMSPSDIMTMINNKIESWITEHPEQWFWVHKRW